MGGFFDLGGFSVHTDSWTSSNRSGSSSRDPSRQGNRRRQDSSRDTDLFDSMDRAFNNMSTSFDDHFDNDSFFDSGSDAFHSNDRDTMGFSQPRGRSRNHGYESEAPRPSAYPGFSGRHGDNMPSTNRYNSGPDFDEPYFPGMPGDDRTAGSRYQAESSRYVEAEPERFFFMRRANTASSSRNRSDSSQFYPESMRRADTMPTSRNRSDSSQFYPESRGYQASERMPQSTQPPRRRRSPSPPTYARGCPTSIYNSSSTVRPSSPPRRRHRSPSPVKRSNTRRRSPSPLPTRNERTERTRDGDRFRPSVRRPEGNTSGSTYGESSRSRAAPEPASRNQYNGPYPSGPSTSRSQSTSRNQGGRSHNQYNGTGPEPKRERAPPPKPEPKRERAPPPKPTGWSRSKPSGVSSSRSLSQAHSESNSRSRSGSSSTARPTTAGRSRADLKKLFDAYNAKWEPLSRTDANYPLPTSTRDLYSLSFVAGAPSHGGVGAFTNEEIFIVNVQMLFLAGFGLQGSIRRFSDGLEVKIENRELNGENLRLLGKWLSRKEQPRWHPDRMNLRTGVEGKLDEGISRRKEVVAMRTAAQGLLAVVNA
jgi:hypothetical protein